MSWSAQLLIDAWFAICGLTAIAFAALLMTGVVLAIHAVWVKVLR